MERISGTIDHIHHHNPENGFCVVRIIDQEQKHIRITGHAPRVIAGEILTADGAWDHFEGQLQFKAERIAITPPRTLEGIKRYLASGAVRGIGPAYAERLVATFGNNVFDIIDLEPQRLREVNGIGEERAAAIIDAWQEQRAIREIMVFLHSNGVTTAKASKIFRQYGEDAIRVVRDNPYQLARDISGIGFLSADQIAKNIGLSLLSPERLRAGIFHAMNEAASNGNTAMAQNALAKSAGKLLDAPPAPIEAAIQDEIANEGLLLIDKAGVPHVALPSLHYSEVGIAVRLARLAEGPLPWGSFDVDAAIVRAQKKLGTSLMDSQKMAVSKALTGKVSIVTGGRCVGKARVKNVLLAILEANQLRCVQATPISGTLHRLLGAYPGGFRHNENNPLDCDVVIIDKASALDTPLANALLRAIPRHAALILIGDLGLMPSAGPGQVLRDLSASGLFPSAQLTEISAEAKKSAIVSNAHKIILGDYPTTPRIADKSDFCFVYADDPKLVARRIVDLVGLELPERLNLHPIRDIQVLCPMNRGECGIKALNSGLAKQLNGRERRSIERSGFTFRVGDKVMQTMDEPGRGVYKGEVGFISAIDADAGGLQVRFDGQVADYGLDDLGALMPAFAISIHRAIGREYPVVVIPVVTQHYMMLRRSLLYSAVISAESLVVLVGQPKALAIAVKNQEDSDRTTLLQEILRGK